jgi:AcrR family transcriptional regulator
MDTTAARSRRSPAAIRSLVLEAARELFAERGFGDVTTREVALRAGVTQAQVFRHFGSKARLFVEAAYQPFYDFVVGYVRRWAEQGHGMDTSAHDTEVFVDGLYRLMLDNRGLLAVVSGFAAAQLPELATATEAFLREVFARLESEVAIEARVRGDKTIDPAYAVRFTFALIFGVSVLDQPFSPQKRGRITPPSPRRCPASSCAGRRSATADRRTSQDSGDILTGPHANGSVTPDTKSLSYFE